ncbi:uncharacterized protein ACRADG_010945 [Cochliomyia hominivorax]
MDVTLSLLYVVIATVSLALYLTKRNLNYWKDRGIPHEEPHLIMGNFNGLRSKYQMGEIIANYYHKFKGSGPFAGIHIVQRPGVVLLDKTLIKNVLIKDFNNFVNRGMYYNEKDDPLTGNLFFIDGHFWRALRNKLSPTFTSGKMKYMYPTVLNVAEKFIGVLKEKVNENPILDVRDMLGRFTTDVISSCAFGIEVNSLKNPNSEFPRLGRKLVEEPRHNALIMAFIDGFPNLSRKLGMRIVPEDVHQFFMKTITDTIKYREENKIERNDFLKLLLDIRNDENEKLSGLTIEEMCAQVFVFFLGGFETSSSTMSFALYELALNPDLQERLREEVNEAYENHKGFNYETLKSMIYLDQVLSETLRKYPILPQLSRQAAEDYVVPGHPQYVIRKGMPVLIPVLGIHHDPDYYPNPQEFDPERFAPEIAKQRDSVEYLPFGDGPRNCIGERFGKMQSRLGLANLVKHFRFSTCSKTEIPIKLDPKANTYSPKSTIYLRVETIFFNNLSIINIKNKFWTMEMITSLLYLLITFATFSFYLMKRNLDYWRTQEIPHEKPKFLSGNLSGFRTKYHMGEIVAECYRKFKGSGPFAGFYLAQRPGVVLLDTELIKNVLIRDFNNFIDRGMYYNDKTDPLSGHLFFMDGQKWKSLRNKLSPTFTSGKMKYMYPTLLNVTNDLIKVLKENSESDSIINISDILGRFTCDIIGSCAFGIECNSLRNPNSEFPRLGRKSLTNLRHNGFVMTLIHTFPKLAHKLGMRIFTEDVHQFFMRTITDTVNYREEHNIQRNDFLNLLLEMKKSGELSIREICAQVFVFFLGGFETSSYTMTLALYELSQQQELQDRLRQEVNEFFENNNQQTLSYEDLKEMSYLQQVIQETLRKYPVVAQLNRQALNDYMVPGNSKYVIKKGMPVLIPVLGLHHDPQYYPNPEVFDPERFAPEVAKERDSMAYLPFGDGPRNCIGERFGQMQSLLGLAYLIRNFRFSTCSKTEIPITYNPRSMTYVPKNAVYLKIEEIKLN